ncbi:10302_t:CDS:1, partial [Dentiscutata heterogama]
FASCDTHAKVSGVGVFVNCNVGASAFELGNIDIGIINVFVNCNFGTSTSKLGEFVSCNIGVRIIGLDNTNCDIGILVF